MATTDALAHAICPKLKPWMDATDAKPHPCKQCGPYDTNYGKALPLCLFEARQIAAAVAAHMQSDARMHLAVRASCEAEGSADPCDFPTCGCIGSGTTVAAAIRAALGEHEVEA